MHNVGLFVDVSNIYHCLSHRFPGKKLNYLKYREQAVGENILYKAIAYGLELNPEVHKFQSALRHAQYTPKYKKPKVVNKNGKTISKGTSWAVGIAMDVVTLIDKLDIVILGTTDEEIIPLIEWIKNRGRQVKIFACGVSKELRTSCENYSEIEADILD